MGINKENFERIISELQSTGTTLVAVSKTKPVTDIEELYKQGQKDFGENYVQELTEKLPQLPPDIRWHFLGHLQRNKVKYIAPFIHLIHGVDSENLLKEIDKQGRKFNRVIDCLLQVHIAREETKFGFNADELQDLVTKINKGSLVLKNVNIRGLMGMASFTNDTFQIRSEFSYLAGLYQSLQPSFPDFSVLSMGMSADYSLAIECGSTLVRIGSLLFGARG